MRDRCKTASACTDGLNTPIPSSFSYDAELSKFLEVLAAPLLQSHDEGDPVQAGNPGHLGSAQGPRGEATDAVHACSERQRTHEHSGCPAESGQLALFSSGSGTGGFGSAASERSEGLHPLNGDELLGGCEGTEEAQQVGSLRFPDDSAPGFRHEPPVEAVCSEQAHTSSVQESVYGVVCVPRASKIEVLPRSGRPERSPGGERRKRQTSLHVFAGDCDGGMLHGQKSPDSSVGAPNEKIADGPLAELLLEETLHDVLDLERGIGSLLLTDAAIEGLDGDCKPAVTR